MAYQSDVTYIRYYTDGSAARQPAPKAPQKKRTLPKVKQQPKQVLYIQPIAVVGLLLSAVMLVMMIAGAVELHNAKQQKQAMAEYVQKLTWENSHNRAEYEDGLDLETIEKSAIAIGMVPQDQVRQITISVPMPETEENPGFWEKTLVFLESLFA